jgi:SAM-dependent methyltransferase
MDGWKRRIVLNAGCGSASSGRIHDAFSTADWSEIRLDIDPGVAPDIVASICDMGKRMGDESVDALWSSHTIEHLHAHEVIPAFREMRRVLKPDGFALVTCPNLTEIAKLAATGDVESVVYNSPAGPIRAIDMLFGHGRSIAEGRLNMAHNTGYTASRLGRVALASGFAEVRAMEGASYDLWAVLLTPGARIASLAAMFAGTNIAELFEAPSEPSEVRRFAGAK